MNPVEFGVDCVLIELTPKVREMLNKVLRFKDGDKFYIKTNGEIGKEIENGK